MSQTDPQHGSSPSQPSFARHGGELAERMAALDWSANPLGAPSRWSDALNTLVDLMLASRQPMFMAWGEAQIWLYNDAFVPILGDKHPEALGRPAMEVWHEAREVLEPLFAQVLGGEPVQMDDFSLFLDRHGTLEEAHFAFSYTPARGSDGTVEGLFGVCVETTAKVIAERRALDERERLARLFEQAPTFMALLEGPDHRFELANPNYMKLVAHRPVLGRTVAEALPEVVEQGYVALLDEVLATGKPYRADSALFAAQSEPGGPVDHRYVDFVYQPVLGRDGTPQSIFVLGADVTERAIAESTVARNVQLQAALDQLHVRFNELDDPADIAFAAAQLLAETLNVSRAGYGTIDPATETIFIERDWNAPGVKSLAGTLHFRDYGSYIEDLKRGETAVVADAELDPRTRDNARCAEGDQRAGFRQHAGDRAGRPGGAALPQPRDRAAVAGRRAQVHPRRRGTNPDGNPAAERRTELVELTASLEQQVEDRTAERDRVGRTLATCLPLSARTVSSEGSIQRGSERSAWPLPRSRAHLPRLRLAGGCRPSPKQALDRRRHMPTDLTGFENRYRHKDGSRAGFPGTPRSKATSSTPTGGT